MNFNVYLNISISEVSDLIILYMEWYFVQHANEDVEKMILGNKCDMVDKRQVPRQKGEEVSSNFIYYLLCILYHLGFLAQPGDSEALLWPEFLQWSCQLMP